MAIRTRFAPSPTGFLHIGGARTALFNWLYAKKHGGTFILRVEDTDLERSTPEAVDAIFAGMQWLGLAHDEGPFFQTQRFARYAEVIQQLLQEGKAYRCHCSRERLEGLRAQQLAEKSKPRYDGHCRDLNLAASAASSVVRFRNPLTGSVIIDDQVHGRVVFENTELDDLIIARSDGTPTYNFTVVVDDCDMQITHVIRGDDHLNNTPRQINLLHALGATPPVYAHVPMILGGDGKKLSKRHGAVSVMQYRDEGYLPAALLNYLIRLGWSHGDQEIFSLNEMQQLFDINALNKSAAALNVEKLQWLNQHYLKTLEPGYVAEHLAWHFQQRKIDITQGPALTEIVVAQRERVKTLSEMAEKSLFFYEDFVLDPACVGVITDEVKQALQALQVQLAQLTEWTVATIHATLHATAALHDLKLGKLAQPLRSIVTGGTVSPSIDLTLYLLGQARTTTRLQNYLIKQ